MTRGRRILAARYLRSLGTLEKLSALGFEDEMHRLLAGIDPLEASDLAAELDAENEQFVPTREGLMAVWEETLGEVIPLPGGYSVRVPA